MREHAEKILNAFQEFTLRLEAALAENPVDTALREGGAPAAAPEPRRDSGEARSPQATRLGDKPRWEIS